MVPAAATGVTSSDRRRALLAALLLLGPGAARAGLEELIASTKPSVVAVGVFNPTASPRFGFRGSGFVAGQGNLVVTNAHVLPDPLPAGGVAGNLAVVVQAGGGRGENSQLRGATLVDVDRGHDLALLRIDGTPLRPLPLAEADRAREGMAVAIIGFPIGGALGFTPVTHRGIISSITGIALPAPSAQALNAQAVNRLRQGSFDIYQLDATAYPGNSGGPVFDVESGAVIAVINMVLVKGSKETALTFPSGISYAIPVRFVADLLKDR
jgi:S1-C subfamily serine protease